MESDGDLCMATVITSGCILLQTKSLHQRFPAKNICCKIPSRINEEFSSLGHRKGSNPISVPNSSQGVNRNNDNIVMGNILRGRGESLKKMGDKKYNEGNYEEAWVLYDLAIAVDSSKASYHSNKSDALLRLGFLIDAVSASHAAVMLNPGYTKAHLRLAKLYIRLGKPDDALEHGEGPIRCQAKEVKLRLQKCSNARVAGEWPKLLEEADRTISSGVDSSLLVYADKTEALYKLHRFEEAYEVYKKTPRFGTDASVRFFGRRATSYALAVAARVNLSTGRFDAAAMAAQEAVRVDPLDKKARTAACVVRSVCDVRLSGNLLFEGLRFREACVMYSEGLVHDPLNAVLLCNRAACFVNLGLLAKAVDDCSRALLLQPNYTKARLRRANCYLKMEKWKAAIEDYKHLANECPTNSWAAEALAEAQSRAKIAKNKCFN